MYGNFFTVCLTTIQQAVIYIRHRILMTNTSLTYNLPKNPAQKPQKDCQRRMSDRDCLTRQQSHSLRLFSEEPAIPAKRLRNPFKALLSDCFAATCAWHMRMAHVWPGQIALPLSLKETGLAPQTPPLHTTNFSLYSSSLSIHGTFLCGTFKTTYTPPFTPSRF